jgi:hypothetical protein
MAIETHGALYLLKVMDNDDDGDSTLQSLPGTNAQLIGWKNNISSRLMLCSGGGDGNA